MSRLSRIGFPLFKVSRTASRRECFCTCRASAYKCFARWWQESFCHAGSAARAALTAASMSAALPCAMSASFSPVEGSAVSKYFPSSDARNLPAMKCPNRLWRASSHSKDSLASSGAGPYSIVVNFSMMLICLFSMRRAADHKVALRRCRYHHSAVQTGLSCQRMPINRRISAGSVKLQLAFYIREHAARAETEELWPQPRIAQLFFHQRQPLERLLGGANSASRFESSHHSGFLRVLANRPRHYQSNRKRGIHGFFSGGGFDEIGSRHHRYETGPTNVSQRQQVAGTSNYFQVRRTTCVFEGQNLVVQFLPLSAKNMRARDHHIDFLRSSLHRRTDFSNPLR